MATVLKVPMPAFTGRYAQIRKEFFKGIVLAKYDPKFSEQKTEAGFYKAQANKFKKDMARMDKIENAGTVLNGRVVIRWTKGGAYGQQAIATLSYTYMAPDGAIRSKVIEGKRTTGYGYDKESTAFYKAAEESPEFMRILMDARAKKKDLGYGVSLNTGKPWFPYFNGGVGIGSIWSSMQKAGYNFTNAPTYNDDVQAYEFSIKRKPAVRRS